MSATTQGQEEEKMPPKSGVPGALSPKTIEYLRAWMMSDEHVEHPYPTDEEKAKIIEDTGLSSKQLTCWLSNNRKRFWKPEMEKRGRHDLVEKAMGNTLSLEVIEYLKNWMLSPEHIQNPYPTEEEKVVIMAATGIDKKQLTTWFSNNRKRIWKPMMDKLREQFGLSESDPLPAALLATAEINHGDTYVTQAEVSHETPMPSLPSQTLPSGSLETSCEPVPELPFETLSEFSVEPATAQLLSSLPCEEYSAHLYGDTPNESKRQKLSSDDFVAV